MFPNNPLRLPPFHFDAVPDLDPDPAFQFDADPYPDPAFHFEADPDLTFHLDADPDPLPKMMRIWIRNTACNLFLISLLILKFSFLVMKIYRLQDVNTCQRGSYNADVASRRTEDCPLLTQTFSFLTLLSCQDPWK
jgi:hypothetical protein